MQRRLLLQAGTAAAAFAALPAVRAQSWPNGPIRIIVGFPPGGGADALARVVGEKLQGLWKQPVVIDNKPGASGTQAAHFHFIGRPAGGGGLQQPLLLAPGDYQLSLRAKAEFLHSEGGLQWIVRCAGGPTVAELGPLEGSFDWDTRRVAFTVPADRCPGQWLELRNPAVRGSAQVVSGDLWIDDIAIAPAP